MAGDEPHNADFARGLALFNAGEFFAAHEVLEGIWRAAQGADRSFLQALIQVSVALHHLAAGNRAGARSLLAKADGQLAGLAAMHRSIDVSRLRVAVRAWLAHLEGEHPPPPFPRL